MEDIMATSIRLWLLAWIVIFALIQPCRVTADEPPQVAGCEVFPWDSIWNTPVDSLPVHPDSDDYIQIIGGGMQEAIFGLQQIGGMR